MNDKVLPSESQDLNSVQPGYLGPTSPPGKPPLKAERTWVDRPEQLLDAVDILKQAQVVAVDAEFSQVRPRAQGDGQIFSHRMSLLQLAIEGQCFVVDTLRLSDLSSLTAVVADPAIVVLLHGAGADMRVMAERGLIVAHYYDLEATSRSIFGQNESSLAAMLYRAFNIRLDKSLQRTDWARRPLPPAMVAYAARDAEMTLALYHWLDQHYAGILKLHENTGQPEPVAAWIEPFLRGTSVVSPDVAVAVAKAQGSILDDVQVSTDCRGALTTLVHPMRRNRLLRLIADLSLIQLAPDIEPLLQAPTSDERAASARALGRLGAKQAKPLIQLLLQDPVHDVRKAAQTALLSLGDKGARPPTLPATRLADGARSWSVGEASDTSDKNDWRARLRAMMGE